MSRPWREDLHRLQCWDMVDGIAAASEVTSVREIKSFVVLEDDLWDYRIGYSMVRDSLTLCDDM